jgi:hypothetical protein
MEATRESNEENVDGKSDDDDSAYDIVGDDCIDGLGNA